MLEITLLTYFLTDIVLFSIIMSYWVAYRMQKRVYTLSLILFTLSIILISIANTYAVSQAIITGIPKILPLSELRGTLLFLSSVFFLYATWRQNK